MQPLTVLLAPGLLLASYPYSSHSLMRLFGCKLVDAEFARVGPCAYDAGLLLATLLLAFYRLLHDHDRRVCDLLLASALNVTYSALCSHMKKI